MLSPAYLRHQAETCLRIARSCFDLGSAERLRVLANELKAKADEVEDDLAEKGAIAAHMIGPDGVSNGRSGNGRNGAES